jgi:hypothetical protein
MAGVIVKVAVNFFRRKHYYQQYAAQLIQNCLATYTDNEVLMLVPPKSSVRGPLQRRRLFDTEV